MLTVRSKIRRLSLLLLLLRNSHQIIIEDRNSDRGLIRSGWSWGMMNNVQRPRGLLLFQQSQHWCSSNFVSFGNVRYSVPNAEFFCLLFKFFLKRLLTAFRPEYKNSMIKGRTFKILTECMTGVAVNFEMLRPFSVVWTLETRLLTEYCVLYCCSFFKGSGFIIFGDIGIVMNAPPVGWNPETPVGLTGLWYG